MSDHMKKSDCISSAEINGDKSLNKMKVDCRFLKPVLRTITEYSLTLTTPSNNDILDLTTFQSGLGVFRITEV